MKIKTIRRILYATAPFAFSFILASCGITNNTSSDITNETSISTDNSVTESESSSVNSESSSTVEESESSSSIIAEDDRIENFNLHFVNYEHYFDYLDNPGNEYYIEEEDLIPGMEYVLVMNFDYKGENVSSDVINFDINVKGLLFEDFLTASSSKVFIDDGTKAEISFTNIGKDNKTLSCEILCIALSDFSLDVSWNGGKAIYSLSTDIKADPDYEYEYLGDGELAITKYLGKEKDLIINDIESDSYSITAIGEEAFADNTDLNSVTIGNNITEIGDKAFYCCSNLTSITIPESVTSIGNDTFYNCSSLTEVSVTDISKWCSISFCNADSNPLKYSHHLYLNNEPVTELVIPNGVTKIGDYAFSECSNLNSVTIPDSVTNIGNDTFYNCSALTKVSVTDISKWCSISFYNADSNPLKYSHDLYLNNELVTELVIPDGVTDIKDYTFYNCDDLASIAIPDSVTGIGENAFSGCCSLTDITIPESVTVIGSAAFSGCSSLKSITLPFVGDKEHSPTDTYQYPFGYIFGSENYTGATATEQMYYGNTTTDITISTYYIPSSLKEVIITGSTTIPYGAFYGCSNLTDITIPKSVTKISTYAFYNCSSLTDFTIPDRVTSIGESAFFGLYRLTSINIPDSVTSIGSAAFSGCSSLKSIILPFVGNAANSSANYYKYPLGYIFGTASYDGGTATEQYYSDIYSSSTKCSTFYIPSSLKEVIITGSSSVPYGAFYNCSDLTGITIPNSVTDIGESAFYNCSGLTSITVPDGVTNIGFNAFCGCNGLTSITLPFVGESSEDANKNLGYIFGSSQRTSNSDYVPASLKEVIITGSTTIPYGAFYGCSNLTNITIPSSVTKISTYAFYNCSSLTAVTIPNRVTSIGDYAFYKCSSLTSITIPDSVTSIGSHAFYNCSSLTSITIPDSVTSIGDYAFENCNSLTSITIPDSVTSIGYRAFSGCSSLESITIPFVGDKEHSSTDTYQYPFGYIFGTSSYDGGTATKQYYYGSSTSSTTFSTYYIPATLKEVIITGSSYIPYGAFYNCSSLTSITIPDSVTSIGEAAFSGCSSLESVSLPFTGDTAHGSSGTYQYPFGYIFGTSSYTGGASTTQYYYGSSTSYTSFGNYYIPTSLKEVIITGGSYIPYGSFYNCSNLTSITIGSSATKIGSSAFENCSGLTNITLGESVSSIGSYAFYKCSSLISITIPDSITSVGNNAFSGCSNLKYNEYDNGLYLGNELNPCTVLMCTASKDITNFNINEKCNVIYNLAFKDCSSLTSIIIPDSVISIGEAAFSGCSSLESVSLPFTGDTAHGSSGTYQYPLGYVFGSSSYDGGTATSQYYFESTTSYTTSSTYYIPTSLKEVIITGSTYIPCGAFYNCSNLTSIIISDVTGIGSKAFYGCSSLTSVTIPGTVTSINSTGFSNCSSLTSIVVDESNSYYDSRDNCNAIIETATNSLILGCNNTIIPDTVTSIGSYAFYKCTSLTSITIPYGVTSIGKYAFSDCNSLSNVTIGNGVTVIDDYAFDNCTGLAEINIPDSVTNIGRNAFYNCNELTNVTIGENVTNIGSNAFSGCSSLTNVTIPGNVTNIGSNAFSGCSSLTNVTIPGNVTSIGSSAFSNCSSLTSIVVDESNSYYDSRDNCNAIIETATNTLILGCNNTIIPDTVTSIGSYAFYKCTSLTSITIPDNVTSIGSYAFYFCTGLTSITIPHGVTSIGNGAFYFCTGLTSITIPYGVTGIGDYAFCDCAGLTSITYLGTKNLWNAITKGTDWNANTGTYVIHCDDGNITKS